MNFDAFGLATGLIALALEINGASDLRLLTVTLGAGGFSMTLGSTTFGS